MIRGKPSPLGLHTAPTVAARPAEPPTSVATAPLSGPEAPATTAEDRTRVASLGQLPERVARAIEGSGLERLLGGLQAGRVPSGGEVVALLHGLRSAPLHRGDRVALRKAVLEALPRSHRDLHKTDAAKTPRPSESDIVQLLLPGREHRPVLSSPSEAETALADLGERYQALLASLPTKELTPALVQLESAVATQAGLVDALKRWPTEAFDEAIQSFRAEGRAFAPEQAGAMLSRLEKAELTDAERGALYEASTGSTAKRAPSLDALFALWSGEDSGASVRDLDRQLEASPSEGLQRIRTSLLERISNELEGPLANFAHGRALPAEQAAPLAQRLEHLLPCSASMEHLKSELRTRCPTDRTKPELLEAIDRASTPEDLLRVFTLEAAGRAELPLDRAKLTKLISAEQGRRGELTLQRIRLLDGRVPSELPKAERTELADIGRRTRASSARLDELKAARAGVNAVRGERWLDKLEVDVLAGGAVGIPGVFSGSMMGGVSVNEADAVTGAREKGVAGYVMPAFSVGGYGKLDVSYTRSEGTRVSGGGGVDFLGVWGGPGGRSWGNVFAGGLWLPQVLNLGVGYGIDEQRPYGALILSTFWPPFSTASARVDTVVRHPALAVGAERGAELVRDLAESKFIQGGRDLMGRAGSWVKDALRPALEPATKALAERRFEAKLDEAAHGLPASARRSFGLALRALEGTTEGTHGSDEGSREAHVARVRAELPHLRETAAEHGEHLPTQILLGSLEAMLGEGSKAVATAQSALERAEASTDPDQIRSARRFLVDTALAFGAHDAAWPALSAWLSGGKELDPKLRLVQWLSGQGRGQEAKQLAEGLLHAHPRSFAVQNALTGVTGRPAEAQVAT